MNAHSYPSYYLLFLLTSLLTLGSCSDDVIPASTKLRVYENAAVTEDYPYVTTGDALVFHYYHSEPDDPNIADEEFAEDFFIEITPDGSSFNISIENLAIYDMPIFYRQYCFCLDFTQNTMTSFDLEGTKGNGGNWQLKGSITLNLVDPNKPGNERLQQINMTGLFVKSELPLPKN